MTTTKKPSTKRKAEALNKHNVICCGVLEQMLIAWFVDPAGKKVMPYIPGENGEMFRVNNCPSCGACVRDCSKP